MAEFRNAKVVGGRLNLRASASTSSAVLARIDRDTRLVVYDHSDSWLFTTYRGIDGYVMRQFVDTSYASPRVEQDLFGTSNLSYNLNVNKFVFNLQHFLNRYFPNNQIDVDGKFGNDTRNSVIDFQYLHDRENQDGIVGPVTKFILCWVVPN